MEIFSQHKCDEVIVMSTYSETVQKLDDIQPILKLNNNDGESNAQCKVQSNVIHERGKCRDYRRGMHEQDNHIMVKGECYVECSSVCQQQFSSHAGKLLLERKCSHLWRFSLNIRSHPEAHWSKQQTNKLKKLQCANNYKT